MENQIIRERQDWIDWSKAIGITLVIIGHMPTDGIPNLGLFIYSFHMPLFIIISGFLYKPRPFREEFPHSFYRLIIPYFIYNIILLIFYSFYNPVPFSDYKYILLGCQEKLPDQFVLMWFIVTIFVMRIIMSFFVTFKINKHVQYLSLISFSIIVTLTITALNLQVKKADYFQLNTVFLLFPFFILGIYINYFKQWVFNRKNLIFLILISVFCIFLAYLNGFVNTFRGVYGKNIILFYFDATIFSLLFLSLLKNFVNLKNSFVFTISTGTLLMIGFHNLFILVLMTIISDVYNIYINLIYTTIIIISFWIAIKILDKHLPIMLGKNTMKN